MSALIRVALVGDQALIRAGLARILCPSDGFAVVAECCLASRALEELADAGVDVTLIDIGIPGLHGIDATARLCATPGRPPVLAFVPSRHPVGAGGDERCPARAAVSALGRSVGNRATRREPNFPPRIPALCAGLVWATAITSKDKGRLAEV